MIEYEIVEMGWIVDLLNPIAWNMLHSYFQNEGNNRKQEKKQTNILREGIAHENPV